MAVSRTPALGKSELFVLAVLFVLANPSVCQHNSGSHAAGNFTEMFELLGPDPSLPPQYEIPPSDCPVVFCKVSAADRAQHHPKLFVTIAFWGRGLPPWVHHWVHQNSLLHQTTFTSDPCCECVQSRPLLKASCLAFRNNSIIAELAGYEMPYRVSCSTEWFAFGSIMALHSISQWT
jgi:hypothetical protein